MITGASAEVFGWALGRTSEQQLDRDPLPGTKFGASEEPQHTTHAQDARRHGNTHVHTFKRTSEGETAAAADGETILATLIMAAIPGCMYLNQSGT